MSKLFEVADVVTDDDSSWSAVPYDVQYNPVGFGLTVQNWCTLAGHLVAGDSVSAGDDDSASSVVYTIQSVGAMVSAKRPNRCMPVEEQRLYGKLRAALESSGTERAAAYTLYAGAPGFGARNPYLLNSDVATVSASAAVTDTVAAVLHAFYAGMVSDEPTVLHMGLQAAMQLSIGQAESPTAKSAELFLEIDGTPIVVSPDYPTAMVAATGPVTVRLGPVQDYQIRDSDVNRTYLVSNRVLAVEFDASIAVRST